MDLPHATSGCAVQAAKAARQAEEAARKDAEEHARNVSVRDIQCPYRLDGTCCGHRGARRGWGILAKPVLGLRSTGNKLLWGAMYK